METNFDERRQIIQRSDLLAGIIGSAMDAIIAIDDDQRIVLFNSAAERVFVCAANEAIGNSIERFIPKRFRPEHAAHVRRFAESGVTNRTLDNLGTLRGLRTSGEEFPIEASISKLESGGRTFFAVVIRDITERLRAGEAVRESEERFRLVADTAPVLIWMSGTDKLCTYFNKPWLDFTGRSMEEELGNGWTEGVHPLDLQRCLQTYAQSFDRRENFRMEYRLRRHDGEYRWVLDIGVPRFSQDHVFVGYIGIGVDVTERKLTEETLRKSEERFRLAARSGKMFAYEWDVATDLIVRSGDMASVLDSTDKVPLTRQQLLTRIHPDDRTLFNASVTESTPEHPDVHISYRMLRPDESVVWLEKTGHAFFDERGRMLRMIGMVADITDRKDAEKTLRDSEERLRLAQQAAGIGIFELDIRGDLNRWTPELEAMYGLPPGGFGGTHAAFESLVHVEDRARLREAVESTLKTGRPATGEWRVVWPDGSVHWLAAYWQVLMDGSAQSSRVIGVNMDITERKRAEDALHESEERFRLVANTAPVMIWMSGVDKKPTYFNQLWQDFTGLSESELQKGLAGVVHPDDYQEGLEVYCRGFDQRQPFQKECRLRRHDGQYRWMLDIGVPRFHKDGSFAGYIGSCVDLTDQKLAQEALSEMPRKLIQAHEQERTRIARELHDDINQRLALLAIELDQMKENPSKIGIRVEELRKQVTDLSNDIQVLSHDLHSSQLEYLGVVAGMKSWCKGFGERQGIEVDWRQDVESTLSQEIGLCLFRVLQEALHNAAKHSGEKRIEVELWERSGNLHLTIRDLGVGFDLESVKQGKGLGLTSMRERVRLVNGTITIDSKPMGGTTIYVRVPSESEKASERAVA